MKIVAVLQARLGSKRLPGKVLTDFNGKPLLLHIHDQIIKSKNVDQITVSTSDSASDQALLDFCEQHDIKCFSGPVDDIITRLYTAALKTNATTIVRAWGDCPFVSSDVLDQMLKYYFKHNLSFLTNGDIFSRTFAPGFDFEIYDFNFLSKMNSDVNDISKREFPIEYARKNLPANKYGVFQQHDLAEQYPHHISKEYHLTIDYASDLEAARLIAQEIKTLKVDLNYREICELHRKRPHLFDSFLTNTRNIEYKEYLQKTKEKTDDKN